MIGQVLRHYKILEKLGEGGMGVVYRAHDTKLDRIVALKFLPPQISATEQDKARFTQEARAAAALNHPHVCQIYRIDEIDAPPSSGREGERLLFIEMEHVDGRTLRERIGDGPVPLSDALGVATQVGEALEEAHGRGIVHRDIKSDNIMLNARNQVKVMDFGLAKLKGALKLTRASSTVGTIGYMAPEQIQGAEPDPRADIFSFGVVLYEMLTGRMPFEGAHEAAIMYSILNEPPAPIERHLPGAPAELLHVISRSLEKDPEDRYQSVRDMVIDIRRLRKDSTRVSRADLPGRPAGAAAEATAGARPPESEPAPGARTSAARPDARTGETTAPASSAHARPRSPSSVTITIPTGGRRWALLGSAAALAAAFLLFVYPGLEGTDDGRSRMTVAVADFVNQTQEPELNGLSGMLITAMEQSKRLSVVTRTHMFDILKQMGREDAERIDEALGREICARAGIGTLVTASIQKFGKLYSIDLKVLDPSKNEYLFTAREEGKGQESIPGMLDRLSEKTRAGLKEKTDEIEATDADLAAVTTSNLEAYQHYFKGEDHLNRLEMSEAEKELRRAVELDSSFGLAWYRLSYVLDWTGVQTGLPNDALPRALALIHRLPEKERYLLRGIAARSAAGDAEQAGASAVTILREMEQRYPNDKEMVYNIGDWSYHDRNLDVAAEYLRKTLALDPAHERALQHLTWTYRDLGRFDAMFSTADRYAELARSNESFQLLVQAYGNTGRVAEGIDRFTKLQGAFPGNLTVIRGTASLLMLDGRFNEAEAELRKGVDSAGQLKLYAVVPLVELYGATGQIAKAVRSVDEALVRAASRKDTLAQVTLRNTLAWIQLHAGSAPAAAGAQLRASEAFVVPDHVSDYWYFRSWMEIQLHPERPLPQAIMGRGALPMYRAHLAAQRDECDVAAAILDSVALEAPALVRYTLLTGIAECFHDAGRHADALQAVMRARAIHESRVSVLYPLMLSLTGRIHEATGNTAEALSAYREFLERWKRADADLPMLRDVKQRAARLKGLSAR